MKTRATLFVPILTTVLTGQLESQKYSELTEIQRDSLLTVMKKNTDKTKEHYGKIKEAVFLLKLCPPDNLKRLRKDHEELLHVDTAELPKALELHVEVLVSFYKDEIDVRLVYKSLKSIEKIQDSIKKTLDKVADAVEKNCL